MNRQSQETIPTWDALRIAKKRGYKAGQPLTEFDMMRIVSAAFEEGWRLALETAQKNRLA